MTQGLPLLVNLSNHVRCHHHSNNSYLQCNNVACHPKVSLGKCKDHLHVKDLLQTGCPNTPVLVETPRHPKDIKALHPVNRASPLQTKACHSSSSSHCTTQIKDGVSNISSFNPYLQLSF